MKQRGSGTEDCCIDLLRLEHTKSHQREEPKEARHLREFFSLTQRSITAVQAVLAHCLAVLAGWLSGCAASLSGCAASLSGCAASLAGLLSGCASSPVCWLVLFAGSPSACELLVLSVWLRSTHAPGSDPIHSNNARSAQRIVPAAPVVITHCLHSPLIHSACTHRSNSACIHRSYTPLIHTAHTHWHALSDCSQAGCNVPPRAAHHPDESSHARRLDVAK